MTTEFKIRKRGGDNFEDVCFAYWQAVSVTAVRNGTEHTHPEFVERLRYNDHPTAYFIRFAPDGCALLGDGSVIHWEAKSTQNIEKNAYQTYTRFHNMGCKLILVSRDIKTGDVYAQSINKVSFTPSIQVVSKFKQQHPIDNDDWICPDKAKVKPTKGSRNPYRQIDHRSMDLIPKFYELAKY